MKSNVIGRVRNTRLSHASALSPLFEAVVNSIYAINETNRSDLGRIDVFIERERSTQMQIAEVAPSQPVESFTIRDNGMGFNPANYDSFCTSDSQLKLTQGGKGVGRFLWLKAFDHAEVDSVFLDAEGRYWRRRFDLRLTEDGVTGESVQEVGRTDVGTSVRLVGFKHDYQSWSPRCEEAEPIPVRSAWNFVSSSRTVICWAAARISPAPSEVSKCDD